MLRDYFVSDFCVLQHTYEHQGKWLFLDHVFSHERMGKNMVKEQPLTLMVISMLENTRMGNKMVKEQPLTLMEEGI